MRILLAHNRYHKPGGEDTVLRNERHLLEEAGHEVRLYESTVNAHTDYALREQIGLAGKAIWNPMTVQDIHTLLDEQPIDVIHSHNTFPHISPTLYYAAHARGVPVVQTLHNYRLLCADGTFQRAGQICERCLEAGHRLPAVRYACFRGSRKWSATIAAMVSLHHVLKTWQNKVHTYITLTAFAREKFITGGFDASQLVTKPNFTPRYPPTPKGDYAIFVGNLSHKKGVHVLREAWATCDIPLKVVGTGQLEHAFDDLPQVTTLGQQTHEATLNLIARARLLVFPSVWYEGMPMTILEAFAAGTPVVASRIGGLPELVADEGFLVPPHDAAALADTIKGLWAQPAELDAASTRVRERHARYYSPEANLAQLEQIYQRAMAGH